MYLLLILCPCCAAQEYSFSFYLSRGAVKLVVKVVTVTEIYLLYLTTCHKNIVSFAWEFINIKFLLHTNIATQSPPTTTPPVHGLYIVFSAPNTNIVLGARRLQTWVDLLREHEVQDVLFRILLQLRCFINFGESDQIPISNACRNGDAEETYDSLDVASTLS